MKRCLITGCEGFLGSHLADLLVKKDYEVFGTVYEDMGNLEHLENKIKLFKCDINSREQIESVIKKTRPDIIYHLAAQSFVIVSWNNPELTLKTNILGTFYLIEAIRKYGPQARLLIIGSSAVYGPRSKAELPIREDSDFRTTSMYAVSKVGEETLGDFYYRVYNMDIIRVRPFNMTGPRKLDDACSDFTRGIIEIEKGKKKLLQVGKLDTVRDFTDGRDAARALCYIVDKGKAGEVYNLCSGKGRQIEDILNLAIEISGKNIRYQVVKKRMRIADDPVYIGDNRKLRALGWKPEIPFKKTLSDLLLYWREKIK